MCVSPVFARVEVRMFRVLTSATEHERSGGAYARARHLHCCSRAGSCPHWLVPRNFARDAVGVHGRCDPVRCQDDDRRMTVK